MSAPRKASLFFFACFFPRPVAWKESLAIWPPPELSHVFCLCASSHAEKRKRVIAFGRSGAKSLQAPFSCRRGCLPSARSFFLFRHILDRRGGGRSGMDDVCRRFDAAARDSDDGHYMRRRMGCLTCRRTRCRLDRPAWRGYRDLTGRNGLSRGDANVGFSRFPDHGSHSDRWEPKSFRPPLLESLRSLGGCGLPVGMAPVAAARRGRGERVRPRWKRLGGERDTRIIGFFRGLQYAVPEGVIKGRTGRSVSSFAEVSSSRWMFSCTHKYPLGAGLFRQIDLNDFFHPRHLPGLRFPG